MDERLAVTVNASRIAERHLRAITLPDPGDDYDDLVEQTNLMTALIAKGEARRLGRASDIRLLDVQYDGKQVAARVRGTMDTYNTRITIRPRPGHNCTCPDWEKNGKQVGPCKHVLKLGEEWLDRLIMRLERP